MAREASRGGDKRVSKILAHWNELPQDEAAREIVACCGSGTWATKVASKRPIQDEVSLLALSDEIWRTLSETDWQEAVWRHPRIGGASGHKAVSPRSPARPQHT